MRTSYYVLLQIGIKAGGSASRSLSASSTRSLIMLFLLPPDPIASMRLLRLLFLFDTILFFIWLALTSILIRRLKIRPSGLWGLILVCPKEIRTGWLRDQVICCFSCFICFSLAPFRPSFGNILSLIMKNSIVQQNFTLLIINRNFYLWRCISLVPWLLLFLCDMFLLRVNGFDLLLFWPSLIIDYFS